MDGPRVRASQKQLLRTSSRFSTNGPILWASRPSLIILASESNVKIFVEHFCLFLIGNL